MHDGEFTCGIGHALVFLVSAIILPASAVCVSVCKAWDGVKSWHISVYI